MPGRPTRLRQTGLERVASRVFGQGEEAVGCGLVGTTGISGGELGGTPTGSKGGGTFGAGEGTPSGSGDGASPGKGGRAGAGLGSAGVGSG